MKWILQTAGPPHGAVTSKCGVTALSLRPDRFAYCGSVIVALHGLVGTNLTGVFTNVCGHIRGPERTPGGNPGSPSARAANSRRGDHIARQRLPGCLRGDPRLPVGGSRHRRGRRIIPNRLVLLVLASGIALRLLSAPSPLWLGLLGPIAVLLALGLLASHNLVGWGDAKLITAVSVAVPADRLLTLLLAIALAGGLLSCLYLAARCVLRRIAASPDRARTDGYWGARGSGTPLLSAAMAGPGPVSRPAVGWPAAALRLGGFGDVDRASPAMTRAGQARP